MIVLVLTLFTGINVFMGMYDQVDRYERKTFLTAQSVNATEKDLVLIEEILSN